MSGCSFTEQQLSTALFGSSKVKHLLLLSICETNKPTFWYLAAGKTTLLRGVVQLLADRFEKRVIVVDTIGGDGAVPHAPC